MKQKQAERLRAEWGDKACAHPALAREYDQAGGRTGQYICTQCGATLTFQERAKWMKTRESAG